MDYEITPEEVKTKLDQGDEITLLDVRESWEFETAKMAGARLVPMGDVPSREHQELDPAGHIGVGCHHGVRAMNGAAGLRQQGVENAECMRRGVDALARQGGGSVA